MSSLLLDTVTFLWITENSPNLTRTARNTLLEPDASHYLSHVSLIEIAIKYRKGKLLLPVPPSQFIAEECAVRAIELLPLDTESIYRLETLPSHHGDPFDRLLICQAMTHGLSIVTPDKAFKKYKVKVAW